MRNPALQVNKVRLETRLRSQRGQSLVETAIACIALVPLFAGVMVLGQYIHLRQQTQAAARAAAWDAAVSPSIVQSAGGLPSQSSELERMQALQFGKPGATLVKIAAPSKLQDPMLTTFAGRDLVLARKVTLGTYTNTTSPGGLETTLNSVGEVAKIVGLGGFPPDSRGLITAEVHVAPEHLTDRSGHALKFLDPLDTMNLDFYGRTVLLADAWNANGPGEDGNGVEINVARSVRQAVRPLAPLDWVSSAWKVIQPVTKLVSWVPLFGTHLDQLEPGKMAPDVVPSDRLVPYGATHGATQH
jgi:hypothetical protein